MEKADGEVVVSTDKKVIDITALHDLLTQTHWARARSRRVVEETVANSICFTLLIEDQMEGFARVLTDRATYGVILDMIIRPEVRGQGLGRRLLEEIRNHPDLSDLKLVLWTSRATDFYSANGFEKIPNLEFMAINW